MKILVACEKSQRVCQAFRAQGFEAFSCDIQETAGYSKWHIKDNVLNIIDDGWDMMIAFPPCTYLSNAGNKWFNVKRFGEKAIERHKKRNKAFEFVMKLANANIDKIAIENPVGYLNTHWRKPDQIIQPYQFGVPESKRTCLWLKNLPKLQPTNIVKPTIYGYFKSGKHKGKPMHFHDKYLPNIKERAELRGKTFKEIAEAMANQWGIKMVDELPETERNIKGFGSSGD